MEYIRDGLGSPAETRAGQGALYSQILCHRQQRIECRLQPKNWEDQPRPKPEVADGVRGRRARPETAQDLLALTEKPRAGVGHSRPGRLGHRSGPGVVSQR